MQIKWLVSLWNAALWIKWVKQWLRDALSDALSDALMLYHYLPTGKPLFAELYLYLQKTYEHQIRQSVDLLWEIPTFKVTWSFDHVTNITLSQGLWPLNLAGCWLQGPGSVHKCTDSCYNSVKYWWNILLKFEFEELDWFDYFQTLSIS